MKLYIHCDCGRYLGTAYNTTIAEFKCGDSRCKKLKQVKVITTTSTSEQRKFKFTPNDILNIEKDEGRSSVKSAQSDSTIH